MNTLSAWAKDKKGHIRETSNIGKVLFAIMKKLLRKQLTNIKKPARRLVFLLANDSINRQFSCI